MFTTVSQSNFHDAFTKMGREANFSWAAREALYNYLIEMEDGTGEPIELDVIGLCCDFSEYENLEAFQAEYGNNHTTIESIEDETTVIRIPNTDGFIVQEF